MADLPIVQLHTLRSVQHCAWPAGWATAGRRRVERDRNDDDLGIGYGEWKAVDAGAVWCTVFNDSHGLAVDDVG